MAECEFSTMLSPYYDGELAPPDHDRVERHVLDCPDCAHELERMHAISNALSALVIPDSSPSFVSTLQSRDRTVEEVAMVRFVRRMTAVAAAVLAAAVIRWSFIHPTATVTPSTTLATWERTAIDPDPGTAIASADTQFDDFIARDLSGGDR